jgi:hypothetical protein
LVKGLTGGSTRWQCEWLNDASGNFAAALKTKASVVNLQTRNGLNVAYVTGERRAFVSYAIRAERSIAELDRAADTAEKLELTKKNVGGNSGPVLLLVLFYIILKKLGFVIIPQVLIPIALIVGVWGGGKLGNLLGSALERRAERRAEKQGEIPETDAFLGKLKKSWTRLLNLTSAHERKGWPGDVPPGAYICSTTSMPSTSRPCFRTRAVKSQRTKRESRVTSSALSTGQFS